MKQNVSLQTIQRKFLHASLPLIEVVQNLNEAKEDLYKLDIKNLLHKLSDSLAFIGSAYYFMVQYRRSCLKMDQPQSMHPLCLDMVDFSCEHLFRNDLSADIKEVTELNKISQQLRGFPRILEEGAEYSGEQDAEGLEVVAVL